MNAVFARPFSYGLADCSQGLAVAKGRNGDEAECAIAQAGFVSISVCGDAGQINRGRVVEIIVKKDEKRCVKLYISK